MKWVVQQDYFPFSKRPRLAGEYRLHRANGTHVQAEFRNGDWSTGTRDFIGWSGRQWEASDEEVLSSRRKCSRFRAHKPASYQMAARNAVRLARAYASRGLRRKAARYYLIAHRIEASALKSHDLEWQMTNVPKLKDRSASVDGPVDRFFEKRGNPIKLPEKIEA